MPDANPHLVVSMKSQAVLVDGYRFEIEIYKLEGQDHWTLEVVDHDGTSHVWDDTFSSDKDARNAALDELHKVGAKAFMLGDNVVQFPKR